MYITFASRHCLAKSLHKCRTWSVDKMKTPYDICFLALIQIMYQKIIIVTLVTKMLFLL